MIEAPSVVEALGGAAAALCQSVWHRLSLVTVYYY